MPFPALPSRLDAVHAEASAERRAVHTEMIGDTFDAVADGPLSLGVKRVYN